MGQTFEDAFKDSTWVEFIINMSDRRTPENNRFMKLVEAMVTKLEERHISKGTVTAETETHAEQERLGLASEQIVTELNQKVMILEKRINEIEKKLAELA